MPDMKGWVDWALGRAFSKKLFVFLVATALMIWGNLESEHWYIISVVYIGSQGVIDSIIKLRGDKD